MKMVNIKNDNVVKLSLEVIHNGGVLVYPTDTLYGFGVDARNDMAIAALNKIKGRKSPISVLTSDTETALGWSSGSNEEKKLIKNNLCPRTTIIFQIADGVVSKMVMGENETLGVRFPENEYCLELAKNSSTIITTTSVNRHGNPPLNAPDVIIKEFNNDIDLLVDGGDLGNQKGSKVLKIENGTLVTLRN